MPTYTIPARAVLGSGKTGLVIGYRLVALGGAVAQAFTVAGVAPTGVPGTYELPLGLAVPYGLQGKIVWGTVSQDLAEDDIPDPIGMLLKLDFTGITGEPRRCLLNAARKLVNRWGINAQGDTLTVYKEDDNNPAFDQAVTHQTGAAPVTSVDTNS